MLTPPLSFTIEDQSTSISRLVFLTSRVIQAAESQDTLGKTNHGWGCFHTDGPVTEGSGHFRWLLQNWYRFYVNSFGQAARWPYSPWWYTNPGAR